MSEGTPGERIGRNVRAVREAELYTRPELAERSGIAVPTIEKLEKGKVALPRRRTIEKLADALGVDVDTLMEGTNGDGPPPIPPRPTTPLTDEPSEDFDRRFATTDATSAEALRARVDEEFEAIRSYIKQLEAAGIGAGDFPLKRARERRVEAQRRLYAITSRATDLGINADFGGARPISDTVAAYVGKAEEIDRDHGDEAERSKAHPEAG